MRINVGETLAASAVIGFGLLAVLLSSEYPLGTLSQMGAGYFPMLLGVITILIGIATLMAVRHSDAPPPEVPWRAFGLVFAGMLAWALLVESLGLVAASFVLIALVSLARPPVRPKTVLLTALVASVFSVLIFIYGLDMPLHAFW
jgi:putative tricarboxylic transport membrane protein